MAGLSILGGGDMRQTMPRFSFPGMRQQAGNNGAPATPTAAAGTTPPAGILPTQGQLQQFAPTPYTAFGGIPTIDPTYMQAAQVGNTTMPGAMGTFESQLVQSLMPQFALNQENLNADLAARGIYNSGAGTQANNDLLGQETAAVAGPMAGLTQLFAGLYGQGVLQNSSQQQQANQYNAGASNTANATNAAAYGNIVGNDQANYNAFLQQLMQGGLGTSGALLDSYLGSYAPDGSVGSIYSQGLGGAGSAYSSALQAGSANASNLANIFGNAGYAFGQSMKPSAPPPTNPLSGLTLMG